MKILITGASGGFGFLTCQLLSQKGHTLAGTMRSTKGKNTEVAQKLEAMGVHLVEMDVTQDDSVRQGVAQSMDTLGGLDVLINNAGRGVHGMQEHFTPQDYRDIFEINVFGVQRLMREVLPHFRNQNRGTVLFVSSLLGRITLPFYGPYNASKWALEAMAENYRAELSGFGIESCIVEPGGFPTTFMENLMHPSDQSQVSSYGDFMKAPQAMGEGFAQALANKPQQKPEIVAEAIQSLLDIPHGEKPFRTVVDHMGMGDHVKGYNEGLEQITKGIYGAFGIESMLKVS